MIRFYRSLADAWSDVHVEMTARRIVPDGPARWVPFCHEHGVRGECARCVRAVVERVGQLVASWRMTRAEEARTTRRAVYAKTVRSHKRRPEPEPPATLFDLPVEARKGDPA